MLLRVITPNDVPGGVRLNTISGWNQTEADWQRFLAASPGGCFVMEDAEKVVGTAATFPYENRFAWISMVLVDPEYRNRGIGTKLLQQAVHYLDDAGIPTLKLDATPLGKPLYEKMGFVSEYEIERWVLKRPEKQEANGTVRISSTSQLADILINDRKIFGADRSPLLQSLNEHAPELTLAVGKGSALRGYAFGRHGLFADHLGPWMARDPEAAKQLLQEFLQRSHRGTVLVDCLVSNKAAQEILRGAGFSVARPLTRMYRGPNSFPGTPALLCAIVGPEFG